MCPEQLRQEKICPDRPAHPLCFADEPEVMTVVAADLAGWACRDSSSLDVPHYHRHGGNDTAEFSISGTRVRFPPPPVEGKGGEIHPNVRIYRQLCPSASDKKFFSTGANFFLTGGEQ